LGEGGEIRKFSAKFARLIQEGGIVHCSFKADRR
jgi:hypothetical protein